LIYVSPGESSSSNWKFHISYRNEDGSWIEPIELSQEINDLEYALCPAVTPDGKFMFFIGGGDIYWVDAKFIDNLKPEGL